VFGCNIGTDGHTIGNNGDEKENGHNPVVSNDRNTNKSPESPTTLGLYSLLNYVFSLLNQNLIHS